MAKRLRYYIGGSTAKRLQYYKGGVCRDPQKWLRNLWMTPYLHAMLMGDGGMGKVVLDISLWEPEKWPEQARNVCSQMFSFFFWFERCVKVFRFIHERSHKRRLHNAHVILSAEMQYLKGGKWSCIFISTTILCWEDKTTSITHAI